tara:strand:+ start:120 stop:251 length:132 start_codon:yes stop_codon:yes gene_type:complete
MFLGDTWHVGGMKRWAALCKFGVTATVVYASPTVLHLDRMARL